MSFPRSADGAGKLLYRYSRTGRIALLYLGSGDGVEVVARRYNFDGVYAGHSHNDLGALQFQDAVGTRLALRGQASLQQYRSDASYGVLDTDTRERNGQANVDAVWEVSPRHEVSFGGDYRRRETVTAGFLPADSTDPGFGAATRQQTGGPVASSPGMYLEDKVRLWGPVYATIGARADYASPSREWTFDPRASLAYRVDAHQTVRVATGRYHELPQAQYLDRTYGNPRLRPARADHVIAGYEWKSDYHNVRIEAFRKDYRDLVTISPATYYANQGHGFARGVDVFAQSTNRRLPGWVSYGYLDTRRQELDDPRMLPATYGVRHAATLVATWEARPALQLGARYGFSTGSVYTPVVGADYDPVTRRWHPRLGERNSGRLPDYQRLDLRLTQLFSLPAAGALPASSVCAFYVEAMNLLGTRNVLDYSYSEDFSQRRPIESYFSRRIAVAGIALTW